MRSVARFRANRARSLGFAPSRPNVAAPAPEYAGSAPARSGARVPRAAAWRLNGDGHGEMETEKDWRILEDDIIYTVSGCLIHHGVPGSPIWGICAFKGCQATKCCCMLVLPLTSVYITSLIFFRSPGKSVVPSRRTTMDHHPRFMSILISAKHITEQLLPNHSRQ